MPLALIKTGRVQLSLWMITENPEILLPLAKLFPSEEAQHSQLQKEERRLQFLAARAALGSLLPKRPAVITGPRGEPSLAGGGPQVSLSHTHGWAAAAVCEAGPPAVDIECLDTPRPAKLAAMFMNPDETARFQASGHDPFVFYTIWTAKECLYKIFNSQREEISFVRHLWTHPPETSGEEGRIRCGIRVDSLNFETSLTFFTHQRTLVMYGALIS